VLDHAWDLTPAEAMALQAELASRVVLEDHVGEVRCITGVDCGFDDRGRVIRAAVVTMAWPGLEILEQAVARLPTRFPYVPGLLSFRELPAVLAAFSKLTQPTNLLMCDGQGIAHPRRLGVASHLGLLLDLPSIGVGKSRLIGVYDEPGPDKGDSVPLTDRGEIIGAVLRSRDRVRPLFVSPGHRVCIATATHWALATTTRFRLPEPIRAADRLASPRGAAGAKP